MLNSGVVYATSAWHRHRKHPRRVKLVGDPARGRLLLVDVKETNGHSHGEGHGGDAARRERHFIGLEAGRL